MKRGIRGSYGGFSLVELLVVITIVGVLLAILLPSLKNAREVALQARCGAQLRQAGVPMFTYAFDHKDWAPFKVSYAYPSAYYNETGRWVEHYFPNGNVLRCPTDVPYGADKVVGGLKWNNGIYSSYHLVFALGSLYKNTTSVDKADVFYGWRIDELTNEGGPLPNLQYLGRKITYINYWGEDTTVTFAAPSGQAMAVDAWAPSTAGPGGFNPRTVRMAVPGAATTSVPTTAYKPVMHPYSNGTSILYADGHVQWKNADSVKARMRCILSPNSIRIYW